MELVSTQTLTHQVFLNGLLLDEKRYEWDSVDEKPSIPRLEPGDTVVVVCYQPFGIERKLYRKEKESKKPEETTESTTIDQLTQQVIESEELKSLEPEDYMLTDKSAKLSDEELGSIADLMDRKYDKNGNIRAEALKAANPRAPTGGNGGDLTLIAGEGSSEAGDVHIVGKRIFLDAEQVVWGGPCQS